MKRFGSHKTQSSGLQPIRDAGLLLLLALLLGSVRIEGGGIRIPSLEKLAGAHAGPATFDLDTGRQTVTPTMQSPSRQWAETTRSAPAVELEAPAGQAGCDGHAETDKSDEAPAKTRLLIRAGVGARVEAACTS